MRGAAPCRKERRLSERRLGASEKRAGPGRPKCAPPRAETRVRRRRRPAAAHPVQRAERTDDTSRPSERVNSTRARRGAERHRGSGEHELPGPLRVVVVQVRRVPQRLRQRQRSHHALYVEQQHAVRTRDATRALVERRDQLDGVDGAASALGMVGHACGKCGSVCGLSGAVGDAAVCFAVEAAHARRERRRRVNRVRRRPHKQRRCMPVAAAGRIGTACVATGSARRVGSLCARHVCTAVGLPLRRHPLHQRAR
eukprot:scaffold80208_cov71-Phaeocystis_antarctica.AAC.1